MKRVLRDYSLSIVLGLLFLVSWIGQLGFQVVEVQNNATEHGQQFSWGEFWPEFGAATLENWQSEFLQLFTFVVLTAFLIHKGSHESKDTDEEIQASLERIEKRLKTIENTKS